MAFLYYNGKDLPYLSDDSGLATSTAKGTPTNTTYVEASRNGPYMRPT